MAQRIKKAKGKILKALEYLFVLLIFSLFLIIIRAYIFDKNYVLNNFFEKRHDENIRQGNIQYSSEGKSRKDKKKVASLNLKKTEDGQWIIGGDDGYFLDTSGEKIKIGGLGESSSVKVLGVDDYLEKEGVVETDIPVQEETFSIYEQEDYLPILGYHYIVADDEEISSQDRSLKIRVSDFERQVAFMSNQMNCRWITFGDVMEQYILQGKKTPKNTCVMTFDDGRRDGYTLVLPILKKYNVVATFYVITDNLGREGYLTKQQLSEIYQAGNEIGSHTVSGGSMTKTDWFVRKYGREFMQTDLMDQIKNSKLNLEKMGYKNMTFAYPLGEWDQAVVEAIKQSGYIAARDTSRDVPTVDRRTPAISFDEEYIWHMHYYKPEGASVDVLEKSIGYNQWWQFEDGYKIVKDDNGNIKELSSLKLDEDAYHVVTLPDKGDKIEKQFIIANEGSYNLNIVGSTGQENKDYFSDIDKLKIFIDGERAELAPGDQDSCLLFSGRYYCQFNLEAKIVEGLHTIGVENDSAGFMRVDRFRASRKLSLKDEYKVEVYE